MSSLALRDGNSRKRATRAIALGAVGVLLAACSTAGSAPTSAAKLSSLEVPLEGSLVTPQGSWAVLKMGHLDEFANTFWQLFVLRRGDSHWSLVTPPGFADNGGLVAASAKGSSLVTGFQANQLMHFSPLAVSADLGKTWVPGVLEQGLANVPDALAASRTGKMIALVGGNPGSVLWNSGSLSGWKTLVSERSLQTSAIGRRCAVTSLTAVGFTSGGQPIVGATCSRAGIVGIFQYNKGTWRSFAPRLPTAVSHATTQVIRLISSDGTVSAIIAARTGLHEMLFAARLIPGQTQWAVSGVFGLPRSAQVLASGSSSGGSVFVELSGGRYELVAVQAKFTGGPWAQLPTAPKGTATVAFSSNGRVDALVPRGSVLTDYTLDAGQGVWNRAQVIDAPIQYGSSS